MTGLDVRLPRVRLGTFPTPLVRAERLERAVGRGELWLKRDDLAGFGVAGNKTRPLEFLVGDALRAGAEVLVTGGGPGSNFCPAAAMAARAAGLDCELVIWGEPCGPNLDLARAAGARIRPTGDHERDAVDVLVARRAERLTAEGRPAYPVPRGGSTALGAVGFAVAAAELAAQWAGPEPPALIVLAVGSGGSCAGLLAGLAAAGMDVPVLGVSVSRPVARVGPEVLRMAGGCARLLGTPAPSPAALELVEAIGAGFGRSTDAERGRASLALHAEGLLLDGTYGAKAFAVAADRLAAGAGPTVYWHTGGVVPAVGALSAPTIGKGSP
ncbi:MAG TPA: pyridoxal-phosphate dependent enzyme [Pseudonocardia sp.]|jgi:1-aminocyclopropane-1-carboxylate deaminase/D-cysteine desulfhydrase-like pyridoxal-dependent ACC family enzyme